MKSDSVESLSDVFAKSPEVMADLLASENFFAGGPSAGLRVLTVYIAYAGKRLSPARRQSLERARELLTKRTQKPTI